jgi:uncharacterized protein
LLVRDRGQPLDDAFEQMFPSTGRAILFSFAAVLLGFGVLVTSRVPGLIRFGSLVAVGISVSFVASLTVLPALVSVLGPASLGVHRRPAGAAQAAGLVPAVLLALALLPLEARAAAGADEAPDGAEVVRRINARDEGVSVSQAVEIDLIERDGDSRLRSTRMFRKYYGKEKRTALFYVSPRNVKGTAYLTIDHGEAGRDDDRWLYLPAARKVRRVSAADRGAHFLGTDFTHEDIKNISRVNAKDYTHRTVGREALDGHECYVLESVPVNQEIAREVGYGRVLSWVDAEIWMVRRSRFWDVNGNALKVIDTRDIRQVDGIWTAQRIEAHNEKTGHKTVLRFSDVDYKSPVDDELFTERALRRGS